MIFILQLHIQRLRGLQLFYRLHDTLLRSPISKFNLQTYEFRITIDHRWYLRLATWTWPMPRSGRKAGMAPQRAHTLDSNEFYYSVRSGLSCLDRTHLARLVFQALAYPF